MEDLSKETDLALVLRLNEGDASAFTEIYQRYWQPLYLHALKMLRDENEAMDVVQELFANVWKNSTSLHVESLKAYLYTAVRHQTIKALQKNRYRADFIDQLTYVSQKSASLTDETVDFNEFTLLLDKEVNKLPPRMKAIYTLSREEGLSHKAIAEQLDVSEHTVKTTIHRVLTILRSKFMSWPLYIALAIIFYS